MHEPTINFSALHHAIDQCLTRDQHRLRRSLREVQSVKNAETRSQKIKLLEQSIAASCEKVSARAQRTPTFSYPDLPVAVRADEIIAAIRAHQVLVVAGETGSGKTTQLPKLALAAGRGVQGYIGHTQPRRIAARTVAARIAEEMNTPLGEAVGYKVRFTDEFSPDGFVKLMTDGVLLAELSQDRFLSAYDTLIIDEAHERSLNIDFLLGVLKTLLEKRSDLKIIITSATIDVQRFSQHFADAHGNPAPIISVEGRTYPVQVFYQPINADEKNAVSSDEDEGFDDIEEAIPRAVLAAVEQCLAHEKSAGMQGRGDILVFSSHEREIRDIADVLRKYGPPHTEILPLYARLSVSEQQRVFQNGKSRRIVIATNVAETSLTVPNIFYVIDPGFARVSRYSYRSKVQRLPIEAISQAAANQRKGRCGRIAAGVCVRLYAESDFLSRAAFTEPEIQRTNLAAVILQMQALGLGDIEQFPFLDAPDSRFINDGFRLLEELGAMDEQRSITAVGTQLAKFPVDPRIARMLLAATKTNALREVLIIAAALGGQDPRDRPHDKQQMADERHAQFKHPESDFLWFVNLWNVLEAQRGDMSENQRREFARRHFLSPVRLREWRETHKQLLQLCKDMSWPVAAPLMFEDKKLTADKNNGLEANNKPDKKTASLISNNYAAVHKALLAGSLSRIAQKQEEREYLAARSQKAFIFPGSVLAKKGAPLIMAAELVETQRVYARTVAKIEAEWVEELAPHLLKRSHAEPHWEKRQGRVMAYEQTALYGLVLTAKRKVAYEHINLSAAREIFIRAALVEADVELKAAFFQHNQNMIEEVRVLENKARRRDILIDEETLFAFYDERIPAHIANVVSFDTWRREAEKQNAAHLFLSKEYLFARDDAESAASEFPDELSMGSSVFALEYLFEPGHVRDGVTLLLPVGLLDEVDELRLAWLVPGLIAQKIEALFKNLAKPVRRLLVPVPSTAAECLAELRFADGDLAQKLTQVLRRRQVMVAPEEWREEELPAHCRFNIRVLGAAQQVLAEGRDLAEIKRALRELNAGVSAKNVSAPPSALDEFTQENLSDWPATDIPESILFTVKNMQSRAYPALVAVSDAAGNLLPVQNGEPVALQCFASRREAELAHRLGLLQLFQLQCAAEFRQLRRRVGEHKALNLQYSPYGSRLSLEAMFARALSDHLFVAAEGLVYTRAAFVARLTAGKPQVLAEAERLLAVVVQIYAGFAEAYAALNRFKTPVFARSVSDVRAQLQALRPVDFLDHCAFSQWQHYPRYLRAVMMRLEKLPNNVNKDEAAAAEMAQRWQVYEQRRAALVTRDLPLLGIEEYRWLLEEYRVSLFAQTIKTAVPISANRLEKFLAALPK